LRAMVVPRKKYQNGIVLGSAKWNKRGEKNTVKKKSGGN